MVSVGHRLLRYWGLLLCVLGVVGWLSTTACDSEHGQSCKTSADCVRAFCIEEKCVACTLDAHCKDGKRCLSGQCLAPGDEPIVPDVGDAADVDKGGAPEDRTPPPDEGAKDVYQPPTDDAVTDFVAPDNAPTGPPPAVCEGRKNCCVPTRLQLFSSAETVSTPLKSYRPVVAWSQDRKWFVTATMNAGRIELRNGSTFAYVRAWTGHQAGILGIAIDPTGTYIATSSYDRTVKVWTLATGKIKWTLSGHTSYAYNVAFSRDGKRIVSAGLYDYTARIWDNTTGKLIKSLKDSRYVYDVSFTKSSNQIVTVGNSRSASLWDVSTGKKIRTFTGNTSTVRTLHVSPDGTKLVTAGDDRNARLFNLADGKLIRSFSGHSAPIYDVRFSPDGKKLATAGTYDLTARVWDVASGTMIERLNGHASYVASVRWSADNKKVLTGCYSQWFRMFTLGNPTPRKVLDLHYDISASIALNRDATRIVAAAVESKTANLIRLSDHKVIAELKGHTSFISDVAYSKDGKWIATSSWDKTVKIWSGTTGKLIRTLTGHTGAVWRVAFSPDSRLVASGSSDRTIRLTNLSDGKLIRKLSGHAGAVRALAFSHHGRWLASGGSGSQVRLWQVVDGRLLKTINDANVGVYALAFNKDNSQLVGGGWDRAMFLWNMPEGTLDFTWTVQNGLIRNAGFLDDGSVVSVSYDQYLRIHRMPTGARSHALNKHPTMITGMAIHPLEPIIYTMGWDNVIYAWRIGESTTATTLSGTPLSVQSTQTGDAVFVGLDSGKIELRSLAPGNKLLKTLDGHTGPVRSLRLSTDGQTLFSSSDDTTIKAWKVSDGSVLKTFKGHTDRVYGLAVRPDGKSIVSGGFEGKVKEWSIETGKLIREYIGPVGQVYALAFSPSGKYLAAGTYRKKVFLWNTGETKLFKTYQGGMSGGITSLAWVAETYLYAASFDGIIHQWRLSDDRRIRSMVGHEGGVNTLLVSPNSARLFSGAQDGTLRSWRVSDGLNQGTARGHLGGVTKLSFANGSIVSVSMDGTLRRWDSLTYNISDAIVLGDKKIDVMGIGVSPDGKWAGTGGGGGRIRHYAASSGKYLRVSAYASSPSTSVTFSHQSDKFAAAVTKYVYVFRATTTSKADRTNTITTNTTTGAPGLAFSADGAFLFVASNEKNEIQRYRLKDSKLDGTLKGHTKPVFRLVTDATGKYLLSASRDQSIRLWDGKTWEPTRTLTDLGGTLGSVDLSSDAALIAVVLDGKKLKLLKPNGAVHKELTSDDEITHVRFGGEGAWVAVGYASGGVRLMATRDLRSLYYFSVQTMPIRSLDASASGRGLLLGNAGGFALGWSCP